MGASLSVGARITLVTSCVAVASVLAIHDMLLPALLAVVGVVTFLTALSNLHFAVAMAVFCIPMEDFLTFASFGTVSRATLMLLAGSYIFHVLRGRIQPRWGAISPFGWIWLCWVVASMLWTEYVQIPQVLTQVQLVVMAFIIASVVIERPRIVATIVWTYIASTATTAAVALGRFFTMDASGEMARISAGGAQTVSHYGALLVPAILILLFASVQPLDLSATRIGLVLLTILVVLGGLVSGTRSAWLGVALALIVAILPRLTRLQWRRLLPLVVLAVLSAILVPGISNLVAERSSTAIESGGSGRLEIWKVGLGTFEAAPLVGVGYEAFPQHFDPNAVTTAPFPVSRLSIHLQRAPHSIYLRNAAELGLIGLFLFLIWMVPLALALRTSGFYVIAIRASLLAYLIQGAYLDVLNRKYFWLIVGLSEGLRWLLMYRERQMRSGVATVTLDPNVSRAS